MEPWEDMWAYYSPQRRRLHRGGGRGHWTSRKQTNRFAWNKGPGKQEDDETDVVSVSEKLERFKEAYAEALRKCAAEGVSPDEASFPFEGTTVPIAHARDLIKYLEGGC